MTMFNVPNKVLVIVAHQDDEKIEKKGRLYQIKDMTKDIREEIEIKTLRVLMRRYNV